MQKKDFIRRLRSRWVGGVKLTYLLSFLVLTVTLIFVQEPPAAMVDVEASGTPPTAATGPSRPELPGLTRIQTELPELPAPELPLDDEVEATSNPSDGVVEIPSPTAVAPTMPQPIPTTEPVIEVIPEPEPEIVQVFFDVPLSDEIQLFLFEMCDEYNVPYELALALIWTESTYRERVISKTNDYGLMQINVVNHRWLRNELGVSDFLCPFDNIRSGVHILGVALAAYGDVHKALMAYNMGDAGAARHWRNGTVTSYYSRLVVSRVPLIEIRDDM
jgi:hypothetical protein